MKLLYKYIAKTTLPDIIADVQEYRKLKKQVVTAYQNEDERETFIISCDFYPQQDDVVITPACQHCVFVQNASTVGNVINNVVKNSCASFNKNAPCKNMECGFIAANLNYFDAVAQRKYLEAKKRKFWARKMLTRTKQA